MMAKLPKTPKAATKQINALKKKIRKLEARRKALGKKKKPKRRKKRR